MRPNGAVIYSGPSRIDGAPIIVIATGLSGKASANSKTGAMVQTWILREDVSPLVALNTGADASVCGGCVHRPKTHNGITHAARSCYVNVSQAPLNVWKTYRRGMYPTVAVADLAALFAGRVVRLGSYGDPAAVPFDVWQAVTSQAEAFTGYTHQWKSARLRDVTALCQASADNESDVAKARALGLGTFRVKTASDAALAGEIVCPASAEAGRKAVCATCRMCDGSKGLAIVIDAHGIGARNVKPSRSLVVLA